MTGKHVLITGGAGFVGSHVADELLAHGYRVRALDNLDPQVHGSERKRPKYLDQEVELIVGDIRDSLTVRKALRTIDAVYHFAATVGVGQSMYEISKYTNTNNVGTAVLLEALSKNPVEKLIVASSMSLYGEGLYKDSEGKIQCAAQRTPEQLRTSNWEPRGSNGERLTPIPTPESKPPDISSIYALSKFDQERMCLMIGRAYDIPVTALRFFNIYGPRQALSNPYTGVLAIFASRLLNGKAPLVFEDGGQLRDFVSVHDIKRACRLALESSSVRDQVLNIGSGRRYRIRDIAKKMAEVLEQEFIEPEITGRYRSGDIRHCFADIRMASELLGYQPTVDIETGIAEFASYLEGQTAMDLVADACSELSSRGLTV
jgi:dTDP-L-rhamnose 4-epimerase